MRYLKTIALFISFLLSAAALMATDTPIRSNFKFHELTKWGKGINNKFQALSSGFAMQVECHNDEKSLQTACVSREMTVVGQDRLTFTVEGSASNKSSKLTVFVVFHLNGKNVTRAYRKVPINSPLPKVYRLGMTDIFNAPDLASTVKQIKFQLDSGHEGKGHVTKVKITDVSIRSASEVGSIQDSVITITPSPSVPEMKKHQKPVGVFFDFDNDDNSTLQEYRANRFYETRPFEGFRHRLMDGICGAFYEVKTPDKADLIVYSRVTPSPFASQIVSAVNKGTPLLFYGDCFDKNLEPLLPVKMQNRSFTHLPPRGKLTATAKGKELFKGGVPAGATYAIFRNITPAADAVTLAELGGKPAVVLSKNKKILYSTIGVGVNQVYSREFYDRFFLNAAASLVDRPDLTVFFDAQGKRLSLLKELKSRKDTANILEHQAAEKRYQAEYDKLFNALPDKSLGKQVADTQKFISAYGEGISSDGLIYRSGSHQRNFGRFGWEVAEGLNGAEISPSLAVVNNFQEYRVLQDQEKQNAIPILHWDREVLSGKLVSNNSKEPLNCKHGKWNYSWSGQGTMRFTAEVKIPAEWKGKKIFFTVLKGIDDTDVTFFNGVEIGKTDVSVSRYWEVDRNYPLPENMIRWGEKNIIECKMTNIKAGGFFRTCPALTIASEKSVREKVSVSALNWILKQYTIETENKPHKIVMSASLAIPYVLYETKAADIFLRTSNLATHCAYITDKGLRQKNLRKDTLYDPNTDGTLKEGWMLFWHKDGTRPFVLYFTRKPAAVTASQTGDVIDGILLKKFGGSVVAGWPCGASNIDMSKWEKKLPDTVVERVRKQRKLAYNFPMDSLEAYALSPDGKKVHIRSRFKTKYLPNDFQIPPSGYTLMPPMMGLAFSQKMFVESKEAVDFEIATELGPSFGKDRNGSLHCILDAPPRNGFHPIGVSGCTWEKEVISGIFHKGIRWSGGGRAPEKGIWTPQHPRGVKALARNFGFNAWTLNIYHCYNALNLMTPKDKNRFLERAGWRLFEPLERYSYKLMRRYRQEPYTGIRYAVMLEPCYKLNVPFVKNYGSNVLFGDQNEPASLFTSMIRMASNYGGQSGIAQANWSMYRDITSFSLVSEDWAMMTSGCRESHQGAHIDMMNCEYPAMREYEWLSLQNGDKLQADEAVYRAAKRMIPTVMRFYFKDYMLKSKLNNADMSFRFITGWREIGGAAFSTNMTGRLTAIDVFDMAGGISEHTLILYKLYANEKIRRVLLEKVVPNYRNWDFYEYNAPLSVFGMPQKKLDEILKHFSKNVPRRITEDQPGMSAWFFIGLHLFRRHPEIFIDSASSLDLTKAVYDPERREVVFDLTAQDHGFLKIYAAFQPEYIQINGAKIPVENVLSNGLLHFRKLTGNKTIRIVLSRRKNEFRHPIIKNLLEN